MVYAKRPFGGPEEVLAYLGRYTHRIAITKERILACENGEVRFRLARVCSWQQGEGDAPPGRGIYPSASPHVLPKGFQRIRHYSILANRHRTEYLAACRNALEAPAPEPAEAETVEAFLARVLGTDPKRCTHCGQKRLCPVKLLPPLPRATGPPVLRCHA